MRTFVSRLGGTWRVWCIAMLLAMVACPDGLMAQGNEWKVEAIVDLGDEEPNATLTQTGGSSQNLTFTAASPTSGFSTVIDFESFVHSDPSRGLLQAGSAATLDMPSWLDVKALGKAKAVLNDVITVEPVLGWQQGSGIIEIVWSLDGKLFTDTFSADGSPLTPYGAPGLPNPVWSWAYFTEVEMRAKYIDVQSNEQNVDLYRNSVYIIDPGDQFSEEARNFNEFIDRDDLWRVRLEQNTTGLGDDFPINENGNLNVFIPAPAGTNIPVTFELETGFNVRFLNQDFGPLKAKYASLFENTAVLEGVRLYEADGTPYLGDAIITSQNGINYNIIPVPEMPAPFLMTAAFVGLWAIRRGRKAAVLAR